MFGNASFLARKIFSLNRWKISDRLNYLVAGRPHLFPLENKTEQFTLMLYRRLVNEDIQLALDHTVSRVVYPGSKLKTTGFIRENSNICELTGFAADRIS